MSLHKPRQICSLTCSYKENPSTENDVSFALVEAAGSNTDSTQQEQYGAEDGEDARGSHHTCRWGRRQKHIILCCVYKMSLFFACGDLWLIQYVSNVVQLVRSLLRFNTIWRCKVNRLVTLLGETVTKTCYTVVDTTTWLWNSSYVFKYVSAIIFIHIYILWFCSTTHGQRKPVLETECSILKTRGFIRQEGSNRMWN